MKFLVDAQLPRRIANWLNEEGHDAVHTLDLPFKNLTPDHEVIKLAKQDGRIVVSKDADFVQTFLITGDPRLLLISTGNINNPDLEKILHANLSGIKAAFASSRFVETKSPAMLW